MNDCCISCMKPATFKGMRRSIGIVIIAFHNDITVCHNFAECRSIVWNLIAKLIDYQKFTGSDQLHTLTGLETLERIAGPDDDDD